MSINKFTKFTFAFVSAGVLSVAISSSLVTNAQSNYNSSNNLINNSNNDGFFGKMGKGIKNGFENIKGKRNGGFESKMSYKSVEKMEQVATKYKLNSNLIKAVTDAQKVNQEAQNAVREARKNKATNLAELETKAKETRQNVKNEMKKFQTAVFDAKIAEAKTLGVDQTVIDKYVTANKTKSEMMDKIETLKNNPETKIGEIETLRKSMKENKESFHQAQKAFRDAVQTKSPTSASTTQK